MDTLSLFDTPDEAMTTPENTADVAQRIYAIRKVNEEIEQLQKQKREASFYYDQKVLALERRTEYLETQISTWLSLNQLKKVQTHNGTAHFVKRTSATYPSKEVLLEWIKTLDNPDTFIRTVEEPALDQLKKYMKESGHVPPGYSEEETIALEIRMN